MNLNSEYEPPFPQENEVEAFWLKRDAEVEPGKYDVPPEQMPLLHEQDLAPRIEIDPTMTCPDCMGYLRVGKGGCTCVW